MTKQPCQLYLIHRISGQTEETRDGQTLNSHMVN